MTKTLQEYNDILEKSSRLKHWNAFSREGFDKCIKWSNRVADIKNPETCFRKIQIDSDFTDNFRSEYDSQILLSRAREADMGHEVNRYYGPLMRPNLMGGRMLVMRPNDTLSDGLSMQITQGFFDVDNLPPPMLTVALVDCPEFYKSDRDIILQQDFYILSYIPKSFVPMVHEAINTNPEECILWLEDEKHYTAQIFKSKGLWVDD